MATQSVLPSSGVGAVTGGPVGAQLGAVFGGFSGGKSTNNDQQMTTYLQQMNNLKQQATNGQIDDQTYSKGINDLVTQAWNYKNQFASKGSQYANQVNPQWNQVVQAGFATQNGQPFTQADPFGKTPYGQSQNLQSILQSYKASGKGTAQASQDIQGYADTFQQMFNSFVGRDPTSQEYDQFLGDVVQNDQPWSKNLDSNQLRQETQGLLSQFYTGEAQKTAQQKLQDTANAAVAPGSAFDQWQQSYMKSLDDVSSSLQDYQSKLFEKIRPQLLTSLKAQGLLDTGGLNQALAGTAGDLASASQNYMAQAKGQAAQDIANQKYNVMSQPTNYAMSSAFNSVPNLTQSGQTSLQNVYGNMVNTNMANLNNSFANDMYSRQLSNQPSLLQQYGGAILGGAAGSFGSSLGSSFGKGK